MVQPSNSEQLGLEGFARPADDAGLSLEKLTSAFAEMLGTKPAPYESPEAAAEPLAIGETPTDRADDTACDLTPRSIIEAMLFVGHPQNRPLTSEQMAGTMRGVRAAEIDEYVRELNVEYADQGRPYRIVAEDAGYRMTLTAEFEPLRQKLYGRVREARLSPQAVELLAIIAYHQPIGAEEITTMRGAPSGSLLTQLVRRQLLSVERTDEKPRRFIYRTTERFLTVFGLESLHELPRSQNAEPR